MKKHGRVLLWYFVKLNPQKCDQVGVEMKNEEQMVHSNDRLVENQEEKELSNELQENIDVEVLDLNIHQVGDTRSVVNTHELQENERLETLNLQSDTMDDQEYQFIQNLNLYVNEDLDEIEWCVE